MTPFNYPRPFPFSQTDAAVLPTFCSKIVLGGPNNGLDEAIRFWWRLSNQSLKLNMWNSVAYEGGSAYTLFGSDAQTGSYPATAGFYTPAERAALSYTPLTPFVDIDGNGLDFRIHFDGVNWCLAYDFVLVGSVLGHFGRLCNTARKNYYQANNGWVVRAAGSISITQDLAPTGYSIPVFVVCANNPPEGQTWTAGFGNLGWDLSFHT